MHSGALNLTLNFNNIEPLLFINGQEHTFGFIETLTMADKEGDNDEDFLFSSCDCGDSHFRYQTYLTKEAEKAARRRAQQKYICRLKARDLQKSAEITKLQAENEALQRKSQEMARLITC